MDKTQAVINFLIECPQIKSSPLYFQFAHAEEDNKQFVTVANDINIQRPYIDGSVLKRYSFTLIDYKSLAYRAIVKDTGYTDENVEEYLQVQDIIDWINTQADNENYPDFGEYYEIDNMKALSDIPNLNGIDTSMKPVIAKYSFSVQIDYIDKTKVIWR